MTRLPQPTGELARGSLVRGRLRVATLPLARAALAAGVAWFLTHDVLGHRGGIWGPIGALLALSARGRSSKQVVETALGAVVGVAVGSLLIAAIGTGPVEVAVVVFLAMATATALGAEAGVVTQAGIASALIATIEPPRGLYDTVAVQRLIDILVGGAVGVAASVLLRANPLSSTRAAGAPLFAELSGTLEQVADALDAHDAGQAELALERARTIDARVHDFQEALEVADESVRLVPIYRRMRAPLARKQQAAPQLELATRVVRVLARAALNAIELEPPTPPELSLAVRELSCAVRGVQLELDGSRAGPEASAAAISAAGHATLVVERGASMPTSAVVAHVRATAANLLQALGIERSDALAQVRSAADQLKQGGDPTRAPATPGDRRRGPVLGG